MQMRPNFVPLADVRELRTRFLEKELAYALSYEYKLWAGAVYAPLPKTLRLRLRPSGPEEARVFHVLGDDRVPGLDEKGHDVPTDFDVAGVDEVIVGSEGSSALSMEGRMIFQARRDMTDNELIRIAVSYEGALMLPEPITMKDFTPTMKEPIRAKAYVVPFFETTHPRYHWLTEQASIGFGTWTLDKDVVTASFDVYAAE
jgi:hypothetical protein